MDNDFGHYVDDEGNVLPKSQLNENGHRVDENGKPYSHSNKRKKVKRHYKGLKYHELRHTHATLLIGNGVDIKTAQNRLGHAKASLTLDFYAHPEGERDKAATEMLGNLLTPVRQ